MSDKIYVGTRAASLKKGQEYKPFSRVTMWYDDEHYYTAGDDTGRTLEVNNPHATQQIVDNVLESVRGYAYRPYEATGVDIDPAFELGDAITINGFYSVIAQTTERLDGMGTVDISAPGSSELGSEFPIVGPVTRELQRRVKLGQKYQGVSITRKDGLVITETDGETDGAKVVLNSKKLAFYDAGGQEQLYFDPAEGVYKFRGALNVNDKFVVEKSGDVTMKGSINLAGNINMSGGVITWGQNGPVKYQFSSVGLTGPWHDTMQTNDKYRRDSLDGGTTWGAGYQFVGVDGQNGQDGSPATVPKYITETVIAKGVIEAPRINANVFSVYPHDQTSVNGGFVLYGAVNGVVPELFRIAYSGADPGPVIRISSGISTTSVEWDTASVDFYSDITFHGQMKGATFVLA